MQFITINGAWYAKVADIDHLARKMRKEIYDRYQKDEEGHINLSEQDVAITGSYIHFMTEILLDEIHACDSPDEIREMHSKLESDFYKDKWVIQSRDGDEILYYEKYCTGALVASLKEDGKTDDEIKAALDETPEGLPVFTSKAIYANYFDDHSVACTVCDSINRKFDGIDCKVVPAAMTSNKECKKMLDKILKEWNVDD